MEQKFIPLSTPTSSLVHRRSMPDVPEDIEVHEALLHLNDPNWDLHSVETVSLSDASFELEHKHRYPDSINIGPSIGTAPSDFDTESRADSRMAESEARLHIRSSDAFEYEEYVALVLRSCSISDMQSSESPYAEVRAAVSNTDDPNMPVNTFRMWFIGIVFTILVSGINQLFSMRCEYTCISSAFQY